MPQMAPYNWLSMNIFFSLIFMFYLSYVYFLNYNKPKLSNLVWKKKISNLNVNKFIFNFWLSNK